jgi:hypothetical protein
MKASVLDGETLNGMSGTNYSPPYTVHRDVEDALNLLLSVHYNHAANERSGEIPDKQIYH